ncbi:PAS domain-containing protein [Anaerotalea alkaliphila]|uniref:histidine kinase n=1 Tax=Anaerotalea alkaliphila TaxID=2662126 RepID=A0A7X5HUB0_9FIRM|nr:PAS domain-containing protein [Anaerotalea alkaliphila]NDL66700.1 PAS domain-containing protein [Anaerotalea alkaliphila]
MEHLLFFKMAGYVCGFLFFAGLGFMIHLRSVRDRYMTYFFDVQLVIGIWTIGTLLNDLELESELHLVLQEIRMLGILFFPVALFLFTRYYRFGNSLGWMQMVLLHLGAALLFGVHMVGVLTEADVLGTGFLVLSLAYAYGLLFLAFRHLVLKIRTNEGHRFGRWVLVGTFLLVMGYGSGVLGGWIPSGWDYTPLAVNGWVFMMGAMAYSNNTFDVQKISRRKIMESMQEGVLLLDQDARIVGLNPAMEAAMQGLGILKVHTKVEDFFVMVRNGFFEGDSLERLYGAIVRGTQSSGSLELETSGKGRKRYIQWQVRQVRNRKGRVLGTVFSMKDITASKVLLLELEEKNFSLAQINEALEGSLLVKEKLAVEKERHRISKEVHDILGHSIILVISLLEAAKKDRKTAQVKVEQSMEIARNGLLELKRSLQGRVRSTIPGKSLKEAMEKMMEEFKVSGIQVRLVAHGLENSVSGKAEEALLRILKEAMTNALKHGEASEMAIALRLSPLRAELVVVDNGRGCEQLEFGNGLQGMAARARELGGSFQCGSPEGKGFHIHAALPMHTFGDDDDQGHRKG